MKQITILIPTRNRLDKLRCCLASIPAHPWIQVVVACDGDALTAKELSTGLAPYQRVDMVIFNREHVGSIKLCNLLTPMAQDGLLPVCDDMELHAGAIETAMERFNDAFPDDDGVLGFHQTIIAGYAPTGVCLIGQKFLRRYPGKQLFCPEYDHYGDVEIYDLAEKYGKFQFGGKGVAVNHWHEKDQTHRDGQRANGDDRQLRAARQENGLIWGNLNITQGG
jgi:hypothetical protein